MKMSDNYNGHNLVFIVGCPRSGTTWLQRLLAYHPKARTGQESNVIDGYIGPQLRVWRHAFDPKTHGRGAIGLACYHKEEEFLALLKEYMMKLLEPMIGDLKPGEIFIEKTPSHALYIPEIIKLLPESRVIHVLRDVRDVAASLLAASKSWGSYWAPKNAGMAAKMWVEHINAVRESQKVLTEKQFFELRYEDMHADIGRNLKEVSNFIGLLWTDTELLKTIEKNRLSEKGTEISIGGEMAEKSGEVLIEPDGFIRKGKVGSWKKDLLFIDKLQVWRVAHRIMAKNGYPWSYPW